MNLFARNKRIFASVAALMSAAVLMTSCGSKEENTKAEAVVSTVSGSVDSEVNESPDSDAKAETSVNSVNNELCIQNEKVIDSPEWLTKLDAVKDAEQIDDLTIKCYEYRGA